MIITLKDVFQYTSEEIAEMLRVSNESIKTTLHRARISLRENATTYTIKQKNNSNLIKEFSLAIKNQQPLRIFYYYRLLQTENFKVITNREKEYHTIFISDPDGNILQVYSG